MSELAVALLLAALIAPASAPVAVATPTPVSAQATAARSDAVGATRTLRDAREQQDKDKRNRDAKPALKGPVVAQASTAAK